MFDPNSRQDSKHSPERIMNMSGKQGERFGILSRNISRNMYAYAFILFYKVIFCCYSLGSVYKTIIKCILIFTVHHTSRMSSNNCVLSLSARCRPHTQKRQGKVNGNENRNECECEW